MSKTITIGESGTASALTVGSTGTTTTTLKGTTVNVIGALTATGITSSGNITATGGSVSAGTTITAGTDITSTSGNITATGGSLTGTSVVAPTYGPAAHDTDVSFCALSTGTINIGTATRTTATKAINIGTGVGSTNAINIGVKNDIATTGTPLTLNGFNIAIEPEKTQVMNIATTQTTGTLNIGTGLRTSSGIINIGNNAGSTGPIRIGGATSTTTLGGIVNTSIGTIAGKNAYLEYDTNNPLLSRTIDCSTLNLNAVIVFFSGAIPPGTYTLTNFQENQIITLKNWNNNDTPIQFSIDQNSPATIYLFAYGIDNTPGINTTTTFSLARGDAITIQKAFGKLYQFASGKNFPNGILSTNVEPTSSSSALALGATQTGGILNIGTGARTSGAINIGTSASSITPINIGGVNSSATNATLSSSTLSINGANIWSNATTQTSFRSGGTIDISTFVGTNGTINIGSEANTTSDIIIGRSGSGKSTRINSNLGIGITPTAPLHIYEANGTAVHTITGASVSANTGSIILEHGNPGGTSSIVFKSKNNLNSDYGYMYYVDDILNSNIDEHSALCVGVENDAGGTSVNDVLILNRNGCYVGIGKTNPSTLLDVNGTTTTNTCACPTYDGKAGGETAMTIGSTQTTGSITIGGALSSAALTLGGVQSTGDINIGTNSTSDIYIGNVAAGTGVDTGICHINKLQVGAGTGSIFRCVILKQLVGAGLTSGTETITGAPTGLGNPLIFTQINSDVSPNALFSIGVSVTTTGGFSWIKNFINYAGSSIIASGQASAQTFNYLAIWL